MSFTRITTNGGILITGERKLKSAPFQMLDVSTDCGHIVIEVVHPSTKIDIPQETAIGLVIALLEQISPLQLADAKYRGESARDKLRAVVDKQMAYSAE